MINLYKSTLLQYHGLKSCHTGNLAQKEERISVALNVAVLKIAQESKTSGCCTYCHRAFGNPARWRGKTVFLGEEADHPIPRALGGKITVPCCTLCNRIKGSKVFESLADIQDFCLTQLIKDGAMPLSVAFQIVADRNAAVESVTTEEENSLLEEARHFKKETKIDKPIWDEKTALWDLRRISKRTKKLESEIAASIRGQSEKIASSTRKKDDFDSYSGGFPKAK